jgi:hypothetical protein
MGILDEFPNSASDLRAFDAAIAALGVVGPAKALVIAECNTPPANGGALTPVPFDMFYDQTGTKIGTGVPTDIAVIAALATLGLSVNAAGTVFTVVTGGLYAVRYDFQAVPGGAAHASRLDLTGPAGYGSFFGASVTLPAGATNFGAYGAALTDALVAGDSIELDCAGTNGETDLWYGAIALVKVR